MVFYPICGDKMGSRLKEVLKSLSCSNGWSYGAFWRVDSRNSMLLALEDAYFEEPFGCGIYKMFQQVHMQGEGIIGQTAFSGEHRWMFSDAFYGEWNPKGPFGNEEIFQGDSEFHQQFSSGIKTIAVISVAPQGVVQFGSPQKILEKLDFVDHVRSLFQNLESVDGLLAGIAPTSFNTEIYDPSGIVASVVSSGKSCSNYGNNKPMMHDGISKELMAKIDSTVAHPESSSPMNLGLYNSFLKNQFPNASAQAQVILSPPKMQSPQALSQFTSSSCNSSASRNPSTSTWSSGGSTGTLFGQQMLSGIGKQESPNAHTVSSCVNSYQSFQGEAPSTSLYTTSGLLNSVTNTAMQVNKHIGYGSSSLADVQLSSSLIHATEIGELPKSYADFHTFPGDLGPVNGTTGPSKANTIDNLSQWINESLEQGNSGSAASLTDNMPQRQGVVTISSGLVGSEVFNGMPNNCAATSMKNSLPETINSLSVVCDGKEKSVNLPMPPAADKDLFDSLGLDFRQSQGKGFWDDIMSRLGNSSCSSLSAGTSECISEMDGSMATIQKGLLTDLGLEKLLEGFLGNATANTKPSSEDQLSTTTITGTGSTLAYGNQAQLSGHYSLLGGTMDEERMTMHRNQKENFLKSRVSSWIDDSYSINTESTTVTNPKKSEDQGKATRKRARPGESTRPRPKDRQQIQDRVKELREIVPNGAKCSIDALLDRTIKHMLFLQSVTKYADKIKQADEPKIIGDASGVVLKDNSNGGGATWAFEVGSQTMVCPIIVEDLSPPGQMLIEMLCEERGFFLEIADIIRGFGLTILKGVMEVREAKKIWARFIVEANRDVTRMDIFLSLVQLLQQTTTSGIHSSTQPSKGVVDSGIPLFGNYQQSPIQLPIGLADQLH